MKQQKNRTKGQRVKRLLLLTTLMLVVLAGCGKRENSQTTEVAVTDSAQLLNLVWEQFADTERFSAMGGDFSNPVDNGAGIFNIEDTENLTYMLYIPEQNVGMIDEAASLIHAMNTNTFTAAAFHLKDDADTGALAEALKENILNTQWICGIPDELAIYIINGEYVVSAFGNAEIMATFKTKLSNVFGGGEILFTEEKITE
ncbi:MAG: hypothetical protein IKM28_05915 [Lachnospiraceae bacterium]|nr:hypothetical protein [Lachnospiraceae bacterium]